MAQDGVAVELGDEAARSDALSVLARLGRESGTDSLEHLVRPLLQILAEVSGLEAVYLTSIDWEHGTQTVEVARNVADDFEVPEGGRFAWHDTLCELSLAEDRAWNVDVPETWGHRAAAHELGIQSFVSVPVRLQSGAPPYGTLCGASPRRVEADERVVDVLRLFSQMIATSLHRDTALDQARARADYAEDRLAGRIRFAAKVEHALKSPITVIKGWARTLQTEHGQDPDVRRKGLEAIETTADRLADQVSTLLDEARSAVGAGAVEDVDVRALAADLATLAVDHDFSVEGELELRAEPIAVAVLVEHLVENAVTHTPRGTAIRVLLGDRTVTVEDDGPGLPDRDDLFEPFVSADPNVRGTGLGLHIVASIVERLGAELTTGASAAGGARFAVRFP